MVRRIGVIGTLVWDRIHSRDVGRSEPVEEWGGIAYALSAFEAAGPEGWALFPIIKVGRDLQEPAGRLLRSFDRVESLDGVVVVPEPNNRVELHYEDGERRCERLTGGVPGWEWDELAPLVSRCDAVYVNFIAGWEMDLATARRLGDGFDGARYADLHSLFLGVGPDGVRTLRPLEGGREWLRCFDYVQMNEDELRMLATGYGDPWRMAAECVGRETRALFVTLGDRGAAWVASPALAGGETEGTPASRGGEDGTVRLEVPGPVRSGHVGPGEVAELADPTGCGDAWGITCFGSLLEGCGVREAVARANGIAARNARFRGATALARTSGPHGQVLRPDPGQ